MELALPFVLFLASSPDGAARLTNIGTPKNSF